MTYWVIWVHYSHSEAWRLLQSCAKICAPEPALLSSGDNVYAQSVALICITDDQVMHHTSYYFGFISWFAGFTYRNEYNAWNTLCNSQLFIFLQLTVSCMPHRNVPTLCYSGFKISPSCFCWEIQSALYKARRASVFWYQTYFSKIYTADLLKRINVTLTFN